MLQRVAKVIRAAYQSLYFPIAVVFVAILCVVILTWASSRQSLRSDLRTAAQSQMSDTETRLRDRLGSYEQILHGGVGLFKGSQEVTKEDWHNYLSAFNLADDYPGVQGIGFAQVLSPGDVAPITARMRTQGIKNFAVYPAATSKPLAVILYLQPERLSSAKAIGFNMFSEPSRKTAMDQARDNAQTSITGRINLITGGSGEPTGFNMYVPYFATGATIDTTQQRQAALRGYVYSSFHADVFFKDIVPASQRETMGLRITGSSPANNSSELYRSQNFAKLHQTERNRRMNREFEVYGQTWRIEYVFEPSRLVSRAQLNEPLGIIVVGIFTALLLATIVWLLLRSRAHDLRAQREQDIELAKDELLSLASHQLRTPATGVKQYLGMVLQGFAGDIPRQQRAMLEKAYASNDRQLSIINEILHLAKINAGRITLARQPTNMNTLLKEIANEQKTEISAARHRLELRLPTKTIKLDIDAHMLRMAIENLLNNAIKYTPPGGNILMHMQRTQKTVHISVQDNGVGIAPQDFNKLFKQFSRLPNEMSLRTGGTGVGLYLAKHLVELHGGSITLTSAPGKGSAFVINLPLSE